MTVCRPLPSQQTTRPRSLTPYSGAPRCLALWECCFTLFDTVGIFLKAFSSMRITWGKRSPRSTFGVYMWMSGSTCLVERSFLFQKNTHTKKALSGLSGLWRTEGWMGLKSQIQCWNGRYSDSVNLQEKQKASHHYHSTDTCVISQSVELDVFCSDSWFSALMCCDIFQMHSNLVFKAAHEKLNLSAFHMSGLSRVMPRLVLGGQ